MRIQVTVDEVVCEVDFHLEGEPFWVGSLTKGRAGAMDSSRTIWPRKRNKSMTTLAKRAIEAATIKRAEVKSRLATL